MRWRTSTTRALGAAAPRRRVIPFASAQRAFSANVRVFNSLRGALEPLDDSSKQLKWYACGPTVYDRAHLGHARAYVSQDVLRRVLERRFGFHVRLVMGVTDVDDKIIQRAKERGVGFAALARDEERAFFRDMAALNVQPPTAITRVSEHMSDIVAYVQRIQANGFAYEAPDGSGVYFHTRALGDAYGKLDPRRSTSGSNSADASQSEEHGGGDSEAAAGVKRDPRDFALWKTAKAPDEPAWDSPWGRGRPGWHIECSAMTHYVLGAKLDVHTGGIDLKFPHHNNEIAQCEAHSCCSPLPAGSAAGNDDDWCKHFVHFGHLYIQGLKMSKSLKNFISIQDFLATHSADHFRLFCLQFKYRSNLHFSEDRVRDAVAIADRVKSFFRSVQAYGASGDDDDDVRASKRCERADLALLDALFDAKAGVDAALRNDFDTPHALSLLLELVSRSNEYLLGRPDGPSEVLLAVSSYVLEVLDLFGLEGLRDEFAHVPKLLAASAGGAQGSSSRTSVAREARPTPESSELGANGEAILRSLVRFRAAVRERALRDPTAAHNAEILALCDAVRNNELPPLGVSVEDLAPGKSIFKLSSKEEREAAHTALLAAEAEAVALATQLEAKQREFEALMQIAPADLFRLAPEFTGRFSAFDESGVPTHKVAAGGDAELLSNSQRKKLLKKLEKHSKSHAKYWESQQH
ncbi:hypothetical protein PybrP1_007446 [[Pythium] brassicae (nom. inval.)]|nr:hypothetical protein PybrP1_007446 [[Pythium] brassicae (nom. inval.)]